MYARALLRATSDDHVNLEIGLLARGLRPDLHVALRVFDLAVADGIQATLGIPARVFSGGASRASLRRGRSGPFGRGHVAPRATGSA